jgi:hypothetical protein
MRSLCAILLILAAGAPAQEPKAGIAVSDVALHQYEDGPPLQANHYFVTGELVFLSALFGGYHKTDTDPQRIKLSYEIDVFDPEGIRVVATHTGGIDTQLAPQDKNWQPKVRHSFAIPPLADPGTYKIRIGLKDELNSTSTTRETAFSVRGHKVDSSPTLIVRNFRFLRSEQDSDPISSAAYRPGDPIWARFDITGYKLGEANRYSVAYGLEVFRGGESMYQEPLAAEKTEESFYRNRYMPGVININPTPDIAKGDYTILLRIEDRLGGQKYESRHVFHIE